MQAFEMHKIHIRHIFQVLIPTQAQPGELEISQQLLEDGDQFGFALTNKTTNEVFQYHIQLLDADKIGQEDADRPNCFVWPKRTPLLFRNEENSEKIIGVIARIKIPTGKFDFRKVENQLLKLQVSCSSDGKFIGNARSDVIKLLPKKRGGLSDAEVVVPVQWIGVQSQYSIQSSVPYANTNQIDYTSGVSQFSPDDSRDVDFNDHYVSSTPVRSNIMQEHGITLYNHDVDASDEAVEFVSHSHSPEFSSPDIYRENEQYMVLYNGNAEVIGNFRALNFYKASDINIKEDVRLITEFADARDTLMRIDGVDYKFKKGINHATNKRFIGYIAQQVESVVPDAVQLIDGILHVDYESLIPYLSESVRANFNDIKHTQAKTERIEKIVDQLYQQFLKQQQKEQMSAKSGSFYGDQTKSSANTPRRRYFSQFNKLPLLWRVIIALSLIAVALAAAVVIVTLALQSDSNQRPGPEPNTPGTPSPTSATDMNAYRKQLTALYEATNGRNWTRKDHWLSEAPVCSWYGVSCYPLGLILTLSNNNLDGTMPDTLAEVPLIELTLSHNHLQGTIPSTLANIAGMKVFNVSHNSLDGAVEFEQLFGLLFLQTFDVSYNQLRGSVKVADGSAVLEKVDISHNSFGGSLPSFQSFSALRHLDSSHNAFYGTIPELPHKLQYISFASNKMFGLTTNLLNMGGWGSEFKELVIDLSCNSFDREFVIDDLHWANLKRLNISFNQFSSLRNNEPSLPAYFDCDASHNRFACPAPDWLVNRCGVTCEK